jgi:hypothetical protein
MLDENWMPKTKEERKSEGRGGAAGEWGIGSGPREE